jgi:hypothetical protein
MTYIVCMGSEGSGEFEGHIAEVEVERRKRAASGG